MVFPLFFFHVGQVSEVYLSEHSSRLRVWDVNRNNQRKSQGAECKRLFSLPQPKGVTPVPSRAARRPKFESSINSQQKN